MLGLCASVWALCERVREVGKGKAESSFIQVGKGYIPLGFSTDEAKKKNDLSNAILSCISIYRGWGEGLLTRRLTNGKSVMNQSMGERLADNK